jgi:hypothetical protein
MNDVPKMLDTIIANWTGSEAELELKLKRYYLLCCRAIWKLLPQEDSRTGIEIAELYLDGLASKDELDKAEYNAEGAAFNLDYNCDPAGIEKTVEQFLAIPEDELRAIIHSFDKLAGVSPQEILMQAAYFADFTIVYPFSNTKFYLPDKYVPFLSPHLLREVFDDTILTIETSQ